MQGQPLKRLFRPSLSFWIGLILLSVVVMRLFALLNPASQEITYSAIKTALAGEKISSVVVSDTKINGAMKDGKAFNTVRVTDPDLTQQLEAQNVDITGQVTDPNGGIIGILLTWVLPLALMVGLWLFLMRRNTGGAGEAITDLKEVTEFLKNPEHFQRLGGKMPKGVLLVGPPGTGKTLLARAAAGEAGVQFFNLSGAEFVEMFVGVGASRVRWNLAKLLPERWMTWRAQLSWRAGWSQNLG